jgi:hypothetical protein
MRSATPSVYVKSSDEGEKRVMAGNYAYLAESTTVEYRIARNCDLMQVGQQLDSKGYGIGLPRGMALSLKSTCNVKILFILSGNNFAIFHISLHLKLVERCN